MYVFARCRGTTETPVIFVVCFLTRLCLNRQAYLSMLSTNRVAVRMTGWRPCLLFLLEPATGLPGEKETGEIRGNK